jgi:hypothetical protein
MYYFNRMKNNCDNVISLKQYGPTCWFNSILMALLYSDESRKLLLKKSKKWNKKIEVLNTIKYILENKYLRTDKYYKDYEYFDKIRPEYILKQLYNYNKKKFVIDPNVNKSGFRSALYIRKIYKLLGVKILYLDLDLTTRNIFYSMYNNVEIDNNFNENNKIRIYFNLKSHSTLLKYLKNPDIIIINPIYNFNTSRYPIHYKISNNPMYLKHKDLIKFVNLTDNVNYKKKIFVQDSVLLGNYNIDMAGHSIVGITCKSNKYVYNGWTRSTIDPNMKIESTINNNNIKIPCELMKFDWNVNKNKDFCLNPNKCILDNMNVNHLCFSFNKGEREIIYIKKDADKKLNIKKDVKCEKEKVINPLSNRCINKKTINKLPKTNLSKPEKICPDGKIVNPKTGRCIKIPLSKSIKQPNTNLSKPEKICPDGKIVNPKTGRCIKIPKK